MPLFFLFIFLWCPNLFSEEEKPLLLGSGKSRLVRISDLARVAVSDGKIVKARSTGNNQILITGLSPGRTTVYAWSNTGVSTVFAVTVLGKGLFESVSGTAPEVVKVALEFLEVDTAGSQRFGVRFPDIIEGSAAATLRGTGEGMTFGYYGAVSTAKTWIDLLMTEGLARRIANPLLYVRLGESVNFHSGGEFPVSTASTQEGRVFSKIEWKPFGLTVKIRPDSGDGVHLSSDVEVELTETDASLQIEGIPSLSRRRLNTKMESLDGETVVLSGLVRRIAVEGKEGLPLLAKIPILGIFFGRIRENHTSTEVLIAMTLSLRTKVQHEKDLKGAQERLHEGS